MMMKISRNKLFLLGLISAVGIILFSFILPMPQPVETNFDISTAKPISLPEGFILENSGERNKQNLKTGLSYRLSDINKRANMQSLMQVSGITGLLLLLIAWTITNWKKIYAKVKSWTVNYPLLGISVFLFIPLFDEHNPYWGNFNLPYGYYQLLRFAVCGFGAYAAYLANQQHKKRWTWVLGIVAFIFNPFIEFRFNYDTWKIFDFVAAVIFIIASFNIKKTYAIKRQNKNPS
jgi:hypothetical protein